VDALDESVEHRDRVGDRRLVALLDAVQQPASEFELTVEEGALRNVRVGAALSGEQVRLEGAFGGPASGGEEPVQIDGRVALSELRPADQAGDRVFDGEERVRAELAVHDCRLEAPERLVVGRLLPTPEERGREVAGVGRPSDEGDDLVAHLGRAASRETRLADEARRQIVHRRDGEPDRLRDRVGAGELVGRPAESGHEGRHDSARPVHGGLADVFRELEGQHRPHAIGERVQREQVRGLLRLGGLVSRHSDEQLAIVARAEPDGVVGAAAVASVHPDRADLEAGDRRRRQRG